MQEKEYKELYDKSLEREIEDLNKERLSCDEEPLKGELFGRTLSIDYFGSQRYAKVELWTTERGYDGNIDGTSELGAEIIFLRCDNQRRPIPHGIAFSGLNFVIRQKNNARFILNPKPGHPPHLLITGDVWIWEGWSEDLISEKQVEHDRYYLRQCAKLTWM